MIARLRAFPLRHGTRTRGGIRVLHSGARLVASPVGRSAIKLFGRGIADVSADGFLLPDYADRAN